MNETAAPPSRWLAPALATAFGAALLYSLYCMLLFSGPYRWLAELQMRWFGSYYVSVTCVFTLLFGVVPLLVIIRVLTAANKLPHDSWAVLLATPRPGGGLAARVTRARGWLMALGVGVMLCALSARDLVVAARGKRLQQISAQALEAGDEAGSTWLEVAGTLDWDRSLETEEDHKKLTYIPIVSERWSPSSPLGALLVVADDELARLEAEPLSGTVDITGAPGLVRAGFENIGVDVNRATVLQFGASPEEKATGSLFLLGLGLTIALVGGVGCFVRMRR